MKALFCWLGRMMCSVMVCGIMVSATCATLLTDEEMYLDPWSVPAAVYPKVWLTDLSSVNAHTWHADGDPIVGAQIGPVLKNGTYNPGYIFSQTDYALTPNVDYMADLTSGGLTATFVESGLYHVQVSRQSGLSEVFAILAETYFGPDGDSKKTEFHKEIPIPDADLYIVSQSVPDPDDPDVTGFEDTAVERINAAKDPGGKKGKVQRAKTVAEAIRLINEKLAGSGKHVELVGHGAPGGISIGNGKTMNLVDSESDGVAAADFAAEVKDKVGLLTHIGCKVAKGKVGRAYLDELMENGIAKATGYTSEVAWSAKSLTVPKSASSKQVPEPSCNLLMLLASGGVLTARRR